MTFQVGDYIRFERIVHPKQKAGFQPGPNGRAIARPEVEEQVLAQRGDGQIIGEPKVRKVRGEKLLVAVCACGKPLGNVSVVLDDAVIVAVQDALFDLAPVATKGPDVYGSDAKGIA